MTEGVASQDAAWRARAEKAIGASLDTLNAHTADGLPIAPLYTRRRDEAPRPWRGSSAWSVAQRLDHPDATTANRHALAELEGGTDALTLVFAGSAFARGFGLAADADLDLVLENVELDFIRIRLDAGSVTLAAARALGASIERRTLTSAGLDIDLGFDPIGLAARRGGTPGIDAEPLRDILAVAEAAGLSGRPLLADGRAYHEAGAGEAAELAAVLSTGVAYLRALETAGRSLDVAREKIAVLLAADADAVLSLVKMRAMRRLWARIEAVSGLEAKPLRLHAETSWRMMSRRDPWTNVMRATAATCAAGLGGADAVTVLPMTLAIGLPDEPARRLARNVQRVLIDESQLAMVDDPAAGAGGFEALTDELCAAAWRLFQEIERDGGIVAALEAGALQQRLVEAAEARATAVATLAYGIVGTSRFPALDAPTPGVLDVRAREAAAASAGALPCLRDAVPYEALRDRAEAIARDGKRPTVFLAAMGAPAAFGPRATYAVNFLAAAGLAAVPPSIEAQDAASVAKSFGESEAEVACLCGTDKAYAADAAPLAKALRDKGARWVLLAGRPGKGFADAGIDAFIHDGCNAPAVLAATLDAIAG